MTNPVVAGLIGVVVGSLLTLIGNFLLQRVADRRRFAHEERLQRERWEREDEVRYQAERIAAYARFMRTTQEGFSLEFSNPPTADEIDSLSDGFMETLILSTPPVKQAAIELYRVHARIRGVEVPKDYDETDTQTDPEGLALQKREAFLEAVRDELNIDLP